jgi:hypothetical protein
VGIDGGKGGGGGGVDNTFDEKYDIKWLCWI